MTRVLGQTIGCAILALASVAQGATFELNPSLAVSEEFTDNVFETVNNRASDYITRVQPGIAGKYRAPALNGDLSYLFDYRHYAKKNRDDEITHSLSAKAGVVAVEDVMFLDVSDEYQRVSLDATRDVTRESLFVNQSDRNVLTVMPYLQLRLSERIPLKTGYRFIETRYFDSIGIDKTDHIAFVDAACELTRRWSLTSSYNFTRETADTGAFNKHRALGGFRYEYAETSFVFAQGGYDWISYDSGRRLDNISWNAGITHLFDTATATLTTGVRYTEDPLSNSLRESFVTGSFEKRFERGKLSFSPIYSDFVQTETDVLQTKKYGATLFGQREFTSRLNGKLTLTLEKYEQPLLGSYTRRFQGDSGLTYLLGEQLAATLSYVYVEYYSPGIAIDNRHVNRAIIELKKTF